MTRTQQRAQTETPTGQQPASGSTLTELKHSKSRSRRKRAKERSGREADTEAEATHYAKGGGFGGGPVSNGSTASDWLILNHPLLRPVTSSIPRLASHSSETPTQ